MMKRIVQTTTATNNRKVYGGGATSQQQTVNSTDMNPMNSAVRKIHNLLSSGAVTVTGPNQPRILKQKVGATIVSSTTNSVTNNVQQQQNSNNIVGRCYICDDATNGTQNQMLTDMVTSHTSTKFPNKIGQLVGDAFMVIVSVEDVVCPRCNNLINYLDRLENDVERVRNNIMNLLHKKYGLNDDSSSSVSVAASSAIPAQTLSTGGGVSGVGSGGGVSGGVNQQTSASASPPIKMQKLNSGNVVNRVVNMNDDGADARSRKVSAVQQIKITPPQIQQQQATQQQQPQLQKKTTKIYKCLSCDFKTQDLKLFNPHYETCKQQNFHCKMCKKMFSNLSAMKQHMTEKHNATSTQANTIATNSQIQQQSNIDVHSCQLCQVNFTSELALKKHMEINHNEYKLGETTQLYTCNHCQFKSTDKQIFDEHMRKHVKPKPFKCRLCSTRFETREQATIHAKAHQPNIFKCGTCSLSFPKREMLVKHFESHQPKAQQAQQQTQQVTQIITQQQHQQQQQQQQQQHQQQQQSQPHVITTQKLLQETIDEALSESSEAGVDSKAIRFFTCHICSLTFIQENYYNQHMETHKSQTQKKTASSASLTSTVSSAGVSTTSSTSSVSVTQSLIRGGDGKESNETSNLVMSSNANNTASILEADIESIFEKMHSDKSDNDVGGNGTTAGAGGDGAGGDNLVITSQENAVGGITFNITIPQPDSAEQGTEGDAKQQQQQRSGDNSSAPLAVSIDMPVLDHPDEGIDKSGDSSEKPSSTDESSKKPSSPAGASGSAAQPVSMPSLDDDNEAHDSNSQHSTATMEHQQSQQEAQGAQNTESEEQQEAQQQQQQQEQAEQAQNEENQQNMANADQVQMDLDEMQAGVEGGQIKFILNENGQLLQLDNHIITDADGNQILVQNTEQIQQLLQSVGVLQTSDGLDGETLQMIGENNQMVIVQQGDNEPQLIDASLLNADGHIVIQQGQDGELGEGAHVIGEGGVRIPVSVSYTADGQPIVQVTQQPDGVDGKEMEGTVITTTAGGETAVTQSLSQAPGSYFALEDLMQQPEQSKASD